MARWTTLLSSGSCCWSARALFGARNAMRQPATSAASPRGNLVAPEEGSAPLPDHTRAKESDCIVDRKPGAFGVTSAAILQLAALQAALTHHQTVGNAQQLGVGELNAGAGVAIVVQDFDSGVRELGIQSVGNFAHPGRF